MTDAAGLYAAILATPSDMDLRLTYADAINNSDPEHAQLIRLQIGYIRAEHIRLQTFGDPQQTDRSPYWQGETIAERIGERLSAPIADLIERSWIVCGFPEDIRLTGDEFLTNGPTIYQRVPVRHIELTDIDTDMVTRIAASPLLSQLVSLSFAGSRIGNNGLRTLLTSDHIKGIRRLDLSRCLIGTDGAETLAQHATERLPNLQWLGFNGNFPFTPYGEGQDAISGYWPIDIIIPELGTQLDAQYGPFRWLRAEWIEHGPPALGTA